MRILELSNIAEISDLQQPENQSLITLQSPASTIFTDFKAHSPVVIAAVTPAMLVEALMLQAHVKLILVVDELGHFAGVISLQDVSEDNIIRAIAQGFDRKQVLVGDLMQPKSELKAFSSADIAHGTVGDVLSTLQHFGMQHCLVVDEGSRQISGLISASDIARKLRIPLSLHKTPRFSEIYTAVSSSHQKRRFG